MRNFTQKSLFFTLFMLFLCSLIQAKKNTDILAQPTIWKGPTGNPVVALTFDDGPKTEESIPLLNLLDQYGVRATFFVTGRESKANPDILKRIADSDHDIANHSYSHPNLTKLSEKAIRNEIRKTNDIILEITGQKTIFFRPPGGQINARVSQVIADLGMQTILYDVNTVDYTGGEKNSPSIDSLLSQIQPGSIVLLHNGGLQTLANLPALLEGIEKKGYRCVRLSELLQKDYEQPSRHHRPL